MIWAWVALGLAYLCGSIPFGYIVARLRGINIFEKGSGNIGATNVGRVLGRKFALLVFILDLLKGAIPVILAGRLPDEIRTAFGPDVVRVGCGAAAFFGHMFPIFLKFRGGKGVATGAGMMLVLTPWPTTIAFLSWLAIVSSTRYVSLGSIIAVIVLSVCRLQSLANPFDLEHLTVTLFCLCGSALLVYKHRPNINRLLNHSENKVEAKTMWSTLARLIHVYAVGLWFGAAVMFNFIAAPAINESFKDVVANSPSDRTAHIDIGAGLNEGQKKDLSSALFGSAVGPIFPTFFNLEGVCVLLALLTAWGWRKHGKIHRIRLYVLFVAALTVAASIPISAKVTALRLERLTNPDLRADFATWHLISLALSAVTALLAGVALGTACKMPADDAAKITNS